MAGENINRRLNIYVNDKEVVNSLTGVEAGMRKVKNEMRALVRGTEDYDIKMKQLRDTYKKLEAEQQKFKKEISGIPGILGQIKTALGPVATGFLAAFSVTAIVTGFFSKLRDGWEIIKGFDQRQADLAATMGKSRIQIAGLTLDAIKYGASSSYSASGVSDLQNELAKLGKTAPEIRAMTKDVLNSATALETDLASAAVLVGGQLNSYGENANQAGKYSDIMANSVNISATSYEYLATALPKTSAVAALNNVTFEKLNATMGTLADQNVAAETAGTGFRNILLESAKAGKPYQEMLDEIKNSADQSKKAVDLFGKENATVAVILANSTEKINENTKALENSAGSAEKLAKEKMDSIKGSIESFSGAWEGFVLSIEKGDGAIAKVIRGVVDFGTSMLNLITPMQRVSDQLQQEQLDLNLLVGRITSTNIKNEDRLQLLNQLKAGYPDLVKNINLETVSNGELNSILNKVNESYVKRIALQKQVENVEDAQQSVGDFMAKKLKEQEGLYKTLTELKIKYKIPIQIDYGNLEKSAAEIRKRVAGKEIFGGEVREIDAYVGQIKAFDIVIGRLNKELDNETNVLNRQQQALGINTEAQNEANAAAAEQLEILKKLRAEAKGFGMKNTDKATEQELKLWLAAYKEKLKLTGELSEEEKKKRVKALEDAKKHSEDLKKDLIALERELLETKRAFQDANLESQKDSYEKERILLNQEYDRKIEDLKNKVAEEQREIDKLKQDQKNPKNSKSDVAVLQKQIDLKIEMQKIYGETSIALEKTRNVKLATLQEKYLDKEIKDKDEAHKKALKNLKDQHSAEMAGLNTLAEAKEVLEDYLTDEELSKVKTLGQAKQLLKEQQLKAEYKLQEEYLLEMIGNIQAIFAQEQFTGIPLISDEEREKLLQFLDDAALKLKNIKNGSENLNESDPAKELSSLSGIDILGFTAEQWQGAFDSLDTWSEKLEAIGTVIGGVKSAFGLYFQFLEAGDQRKMRRLEAANRKEQNDLASKLEKGYITQEVYNARKEKLDQDLANKKAELEYKQAKRQKIMNAADVVVNTAMAVSKALAQGGFVFGIPWAAVIGALGAVQLAAVLAQPLPPKNGGFKDGGFTGHGNENDSPGPVHYDEYVIPKKVLFSGDPIVPSIVGYIEAKRTGKVTATSATGDYANNDSRTQTSQNTFSDGQLIYVLGRVATVLEKLEEDGLAAWLVNDLPTAKKIREKQRELEKLENQAKS